MLVLLTYKIFLIFLGDLVLRLGNSVYIFFLSPVVITLGSMALTTLYLRSLFSCSVCLLSLPYSPVSFPLLTPLTVTPNSLHFPV